MMRRKFVPLAILFFVGFVMFACVTNLTRAQPPSPVSSQP